MMEERVMNLEAEVKSFNSEVNAYMDEADCYTLAANQISEVFERYMKKGSKKKYRVFAECVTVSYIDIEATDEQEARDIAEDMDGGDFIVCNDAGDWRITTVDPL